MITKADISLVRSLADKKGRRENNALVVEGRKMVSEALSSGMRVLRVFGTEEFAGIEGCEVGSPKDIERMSAFKTPQGILAVVEIPVYDMPGEAGKELTLALDGVQDPGNFGTIMRIADWFGIKDILCSPQTADCYGPKAVQASMGAIFRVRAHYVNLAEILAGASAKSVPVYGTFLEGINIYNTKLTGNSGIVVLGSEGNGISKEVAAATTHKLYIPPYPAGNPTVESLNVGVAAAIVCSEFRRSLPRHG